MNSAPVQTLALCILSMVFAASSPAAPATEEPETTRETRTIRHLNAPSPAAMQEFRQAIRALESQSGAYADQLAEYLDGLGLDLQRAGKHEEAIEAFKRGVHLARINEGLYTPRQIPLLEREIASYIALGEYAIADERQSYLYRVQMRALESGPDRAEAFLQQAQWQYNAYQLELGAESFSRLLSMWDLYSMALGDIADREGQGSPSLISPLQGMLLAQYLIAGYDMSELEYSLTNADSLGVQSRYNRVAAYRAQSFRKGEAVIQAIYDLQALNFGNNSPQTAEARALKGDWLQYHGQRSAAREAYIEAVGELLPREDAETQVDKLFGQPAELLSSSGVRPWPEPVEVREGVLVLQFAVSDSGRVTDLERVDENELSDGKTYRVMRTLRNTRFRPRLEVDGPIDTEVVVRAYDIE